MSPRREPQRTSPATPGPTDLAIDALLDTSILIASKEPVDPPAASAISVVTLGELRAGVLRAKDPNTRAARQARLAAIRDTYEPLHVDEPIAERYGDLLAVARDTGRITTATDLLIIATAAATGRTLYTLDERQARLAESTDLPVVVSRSESG